MVDALGGDEAAFFVALEHDASALGERVQRSLLRFGDVHGRGPKGVAKGAPNAQAREAGEFPGLGYERRA
jgi:hypothetical protein